MISDFNFQRLKIFLSIFGEAEILSYICIVIFAEVVELADTLALGASAYALRVRVPSSVQNTTNKKGRFRVLFYYTAKK